MKYALLLAAAAAVLGAAAADCNAFADVERRLPCHDCAAATASFTVRRADESHPN